MQKKMVRIVVLAAVCVAFFAAFGVAAALDTWHNIGVASVSSYYTSQGFVDGWGAPYLRTGYNPSADPIESFLKFDLSSIVIPSGQMAQVSYAKVQIYRTGGDNNWTDGIYATTTDDTWTQAAMTYANKPTLGALLDSKMSNVNGTNFTSSTLAAFVQQELNGNKIVTFGLKAIDAPDTQHVYYGYADSWTELVVTYDLVAIPIDPADFNGDGDVNFQDFAMFAQDWMRCVEPTDLNCEHPW
jgi:hypothetical protein